MERRFASPVAAVFFFAYALSVTLMPALALALLNGESAVFWLLTGDAYLYLGIAETTEGGVFSFDGEAPTNGFHPLWQIYATLLSGLVGDDQMALMTAVAWSAVGFATLGICLLGLAIRRATGSWLLGVLVTPGVHFLLVGQGIDNLSVWQFFSGMEAGLSLALTGLAALIIAAWPAGGAGLGRWLLLGSVLAVLMLARLDDIFVAPAIGLAWLFWTRGTLLARLPAVILLGAPVAIALGAYWAYNLSYAGVLMPVSGAAKGEGALVSNGYVTLATLVSPLFDLRQAFTAYQGDRLGLYLGGFRVVELVFPALLALVLAIAIRRLHRDAPWAPLVFGMLMAIVIKAGYNFVFVNYWHQAPWYFAFAMGTLSFATALVLAPAWNRLAGAAPVVAFGAAMLLAAVGFLQASLVHTRHALNSEPGERRAFWEAGADIDATLEAARPGAKVMEFGDGMINFTLARPVRHGFVFAGDPDSLAALQAARLLSASHDDGYVILTSFEYLRWPEAATTRTSDEIRAFLEASFLDSRVKAELGGFDFEVVHVYAPLDIPFIALTRRPG